MIIAHKYVCSNVQYSFCTRVGLLYHLFHAFASVLQVILHLFAHETSTNARVCSAPLSVSVVVICGWVISMMELMGSHEVGKWT